jgi:hypothetical protein
MASLAKLNPRVRFCPLVPPVGSRSGRGKTIGLCYENVAAASIHLVKRHWSSLGATGDLSVRADTDSKLPVASEVKLDQCRSNMIAKGPGPISASFSWRFRVTCRSTRA